jgi:hypothetical protein
LGRASAALGSFAGLKRKFAFRKAAGKGQVLGRKKEKWKEKWTSVRKEMKIWAGLPLHWEVLQG